MLFFQNLLSVLKKHKVVFFTYVAMILIPFFVLIICITNANSIMRKDAKQYQSSVLYQKQTSCDALLKSAQVATSMISADTDTKSLAKCYEFSPVEMYRVYKYASFISDIKDEYSFISSLGVYFYNNDSFIVENKRYPKQLYDYYLAKYGLSFSDFCDKTTGVSGYFFIEDENNPLLVIYQNNLNLHNKNKVYTTFAIISWDTIITELGLNSPESQSGHYLFLLSPVNTAICADHTYFDASIIPDYETFISNDIIESDSMLYSSVQSNLYPFLYCIQMQKSHLYEDINNLLAKYIMGMVISLIIAFFLAVIFTQKSYAPVNYVLAMLENQQQDQKITLSENYQKIESSLRELLSDNRKLAHQSTVYDQATAQRTLYGFLKGIYPNEDWILDFHENEASISSIDAYQVMLFNFSNIENSKFIRQQKESRESYSLLFFSAKNVIDETFIKQSDDTDLGISIVQDNTVICILPYQEDSIDTLRDKAKNCCDLFKNIFEVDAGVTISGAHNLWTELSEAYDEANVLALHNSFWNEDSNVVLFTDEALEARADGSELLQLKKKLSNSLLADNYDVSKEIIDEIIDNYLLHGVKYIAYNKCQADSIIGMLIDKMSDMGLEDSVKVQYASRFLECNSRHELKLEITNLFDEMLSYRDSKNTENEWVNEVKAYIDENYTDPNLSVAYIAEHFSISASHIGSRFRKLTGYGLLDYIHTLRTAKCKELLKQGYTIKDCAAKTGYSDIKTLQRAFKRFEGITPGQFKEQEQ